MHDSATLEFMIISWEILAAVIAWILVYIIIRETIQETGETARKERRKRPLPPKEIEIPPMGCIRRVSINGFDMTREEIKAVLEKYQKEGDNKK